MISAYVPNVFGPPLADDAPPERKASFDREMDRVYGQPEGTHSKARLVDRMEALRESNGEAFDLVMDFMKLLGETPADVMESALAESGLGALLGERSEVVEAAGGIS